MTLQELSLDLAAKIEASAACVIRVEGRRRPSSGTVWSADGLIVAGNHAVDLEQDVPIGLADGSTATAAVVGRDAGTDIVLLRASETHLAPVRWSGTSDVRLGHAVIGLSRPGRALRAQLGIVSALADAWRSSSGGRLERYLESDLALHPGFSGGPLLGADGAALGINTAGLLRGTSLAVPAETVRRVVEALLSTGRLRRGYLGIGTQPIALPPDLRARVEQPSALIVLSVQPDSPAARAGVELRDVLLKGGGESLTHAAALLPLLDEERVGSELKLELLRAGQAVTVTIVVSERALA